MNSIALDASAPPKDRSWARAATIVVANALVGVAAWSSDRLFSPEFSPGWAVAFVAISGCVAIANPSNRLLARGAAQALVVALAVVVSVKVYDGSAAHDSWRSVTRGLGDVVSARWPAPTSAVAAGAVAFLAASCAAIVSELAWTRRYSAVLLLPPSLLLGLIAALSSAAGPPPTAAVAAFAGLAALTLRQASLARAERRHGPAPDAQRRVGAVVASLVALVAFIPVAMGVGSAADRWDLRSVREPQDQVDVAVSPLSRLDEYASMGAAGTPMFSVRPIPKLDRFRFVALNTFSGLAWMPGADFRPIGRALQRTEGAVVSPAEVIIGAWRDRWIPYGGTAVSIDRTVRTDDTRSGLYLSSPLPADTRVRLGLIENDLPLGDPRLTNEPPDLGALARVLVDMPPEIQNIADAIVRNLKSPVEKAQALSEFFRTRFVRQDTLPKGHALAQLRLMLVETRSGTREQLVAGYALLAAAAGLPVRVAVGVRLTPTAGGFANASSADVDAWPEIKLGQRWASIDIEPGTEPKPGSAVGLIPAQPPDVQPANALSDQQPTTNTDDTADQPAAAGVAKRRPWWQIGVLSALAAALLVGLMYVIGVPLLKRRRQRLRRSATDPSTAIVGAFRTTVDHLVDLGFEPKPSDTDLEVARSGGRQPYARASSGEVSRLARMSTTATFAAAEPPADAADVAWELAEAATELTNAEVSRTRRAAALLSTRSLRNRW